MNAPKTIGPSEISGELSGTARWAALDAARGIAIAAMIVFHSSWDLSQLGLIETDIVVHPGWRMFARAIAGSFLFLVGVSLVLGHGKRIRWRLFGQRLAMIAAAALGVTIVSWVVFPDSYIFFGILHAIALSSVLALPFLSAPVLVVVGTAGLMFAGPFLFASPSFDAPMLAWLGLGTRVPLTNDLEPVFPWFGCVLGGVAGRRIGGPLLARTNRQAGSRTRVVRGLMWAGRHSLAIYLAHQPILFGLLWLVAQGLGPNPAAEAAPFQRTCQANCLEAGRAQAVCRTSCSCTVDELRRENLWRKAIQGQLSATESERVSILARRCFAGER